MLDFKREASTVNKKLLLGGYMCVNGRTFYQMVTPQVVRPQTKYQNMFKPRQVLALNPFSINIQRAFLHRLNTNQPIRPEKTYSSFSSFHIYQKITKLIRMNNTS